jgi:hypothetical protein
MDFKTETKQGWRVISGLLSVILFVSAISMVGQPECFAKTVVLQWDPVTDPNLKGYKVYYQADSSTQPFQGTEAAQGVSPIDVNNKTSATISGLDPTRAYFFAVTAYNASGTESLYSNIAELNVLSVTLSGNGAGNVNSSPSGISCLSGTCVSQFGNGSSITLYATPANSSTTLAYFSNWSKECASTSGSSCTVDMTANKSVTVTFTTRQPVHIAGGSDYSSLQSAYAAAANNGNLQAQAVTLSGDFTVNSNYTVSLNGGYNADYSVVSGNTVMVGTLSMAKGTFIVEDLVIK